MGQCPYCFGVPTDRVQTREMLFGLRQPFAYARCGSCRSLWLLDPPGDMSSYYGDDYYSMGRRAARRTPPMRRLWTQVLLHAPAAVLERYAGTRLVHPYLRWFRGLGVGLGTRIADIGSGDGLLIERMANHGFKDLWGYDPFVPADRDGPAVHIRRRGIESTDGPFSLIMLNHSLEHVPDPEETLETVRSALGTRGRVLVRIPLADTFADRTYSADWFGLDPPRHLSVPSRRGFETLAGRVGFEVERVFYDSLPQQFWASERYQQDVPLSDVREASRLDRDRAMLARARKLNRAQDGDRAGFVLAAT